ncbi:hypothetical protein NM208_g14583 [Fusarium decemcellulare]|uniref:Uncharacterized protein n=1 Tax=Fusarium decemcellulare TaxID=57161 RepID=A0ACC1RI41_9HYPO|nr:hypothetical protein NM208_g14583 [Fusarium decemcellulare]
MAFGTLRQKSVKGIHILTDNIEAALLLTAELCHTVAVHLERPEGANRVLVDSLELGVILGLTLQIHLSEHVQGGLLTVLTEAGTTLGLNGTGQLPATLASLEAESFTVVASSNDLILAGPDQALERQLLRGDGDNSARWLLPARRGRQQ